MIAPAIEDLRDPERYRHANRQALRNPSVWNFLDACAISLPCHPQGEAPVGMMLAACGGKDRALLTLGATIESAIGS